MNKPIRTISIFCLLLFVALLVNTTWLQYGRAASLDKDPKNRRIIEAAYSRERGAILVGREPVAESVKSDDKYDYQRTYAQPFKYAPITGSFSFFNQTGLERTQNPVLSGDDSSLFVDNLLDLFSNQQGKGGNVELTIDAKAQDAAYAGLSALPGAVKGSVVALEPRTGKILAMVSLPTYDPNKLAAHDFSSVDDDYDRLAADPAQPLLNRATQQTLPPGSTFKIVTAAAAIEDKLYTSSDDVPGGATYQLPQTSGESGLVDNEGRDCGSGKSSSIPFAQAMENSCNTTFAQLGVQLGADRLREQAEAFGFNTDYLRDLRPQAESVFPTEANEPQAGQAGIGQYDVRASALQMAMVVAGIANQGTVMRPYLVDEVQSPDFDVLDNRQPKELSSHAVSPSTADQLTDLLVSTVDNGTASPAAIPGFSVAGKTGTAQSGDPDVPPYAWFVSFAPADNPQVAVAVQIESADIPREEIAGGVYGGPIAKAVMEAVIK